MQNVSDLSQLHQLRGRVGRGSEQSYCILLADPKSENGKERMKIMTETNDGFVLSERDLELRGPGISLGRNRAVYQSLKWQIWSMILLHWKQLDKTLLF